MTEERARYTSPECNENKFNIDGNLYELRGFIDPRLKENDILTNSFCNGEEIHMLGMNHHYHSSTNGHVWLEQKVTNDEKINFASIEHVESCKEKNMYVATGCFQCRSRVLNETDVYVNTLHAFSADGYGWLPADSYDCNFMRKLREGGRKDANENEREGDRDDERMDERERERVSDNESGRGSNEVSERESNTVDGREQINLIPMCVAYGKGMFVSNVIVRVTHEDDTEEMFTFIFYSEDGRNWKYALCLEHPFSKLIYGNEKFVMVSRDGFSAWSIDGINWNVATVENAGGRCYIDVIYYINGKYTGICHKYNENVRYTVKELSNKVLDALIAKIDKGELESSGVIYDAVKNGSRACVMYSDDGETWTVTNDYVIDRVVYDEYEKHLLRMPKSILKMLVYRTIAMMECSSSITEKDGKFITTVMPYNAILCSDDGKSWRLLRMMHDYMEIEKHESFGYDTYVGVTTESVIYTSTDCENWFLGRMYEIEKSI